jgi:5-methylcytosine-specific restriction endonuclease McrA
MTDRTCSVNDCDRPHCAKSFCLMHYRRWRKTGSTDAAPPFVPKTCSVDGCDTVATKRGWCNTHWWRWRYRGSTDDPQPKTHCVNGHEFTPENTRIDTRGTRQCRKCSSARTKACWEALTPSEQKRRKTEGDRAWRERDPEGFRLARSKAVAKYRQDNPVKYREYAAARRAWQGGTQISRAWFDAIIAEYGMWCHICGIPIATLGDLHFDHVVPRMRGGKHVQENVKPAHGACNVRKGTRLMEELNTADIRAWAQEQAAIFNAG